MCQIYLPILTMALPLWWFVIQIYLLILASTVLFFFSLSVLFKFPSSLSPGAPYHPSHRTIDGTMETSTLLNGIFLILEGKPFKVYIAPLHRVKIGLLWHFFVLICILHSFKVLMIVFFFSTQFMLYFYIQHPRNVLSMFKF